MTARALLVLALAAVPSLAAAAKWEKVADTGAAAAFVDRESLRRTGNQVRGTVEWRWPKAVESNDSGTSRSYVMERQVQIANCDNRAYGVLEGTRYADTAGIDPVNSFKYDESTLPYSVAPARTIRDLVVVHVCQAAPTAATRKP